MKSPALTHFEFGEYNIINNTNSFSQG